MNIMSAFEKITLAIKSWVDENKVQKVSGQGLSTNDFTNDYKAKLDNIDNTLVGKAVGNYAEIFNNYEDNKALGGYSTAKGYKTIAGYRGFCIKSITDGLSNETVIPETTIEATNSYTFTGVTLEEGATYHLKMSGYVGCVGETTESINIDKNYTAFYEKDFDLVALMIEEYLVDLPCYGGHNNTTSVLTIGHSKNNSASSMFLSITPTGNYNGLINFNLTISLLKTSHSSNTKNIEISDTTGIKINDIFSLYSSQLSGVFESVGKVSAISGNSLCVVNNGDSFDLLEQLDKLANHITDSDSEYIWFPDNLGLNGDLILGDGAEAAGYETKATGKYSHAEGLCTVASGTGAHVEGGYTTGENGEILINIASGVRSHVEGSGNEASDYDTHAEGSRNVASAKQAHAEGFATKATANQAHTEGSWTKATGSAAHAEGWETEANGEYSHSEGHKTIAGGNSAHAEGSGTKATAVSSHAEGMATSADRDGAHSEGMNTTAKGFRAHAEGQSSIKSEDYSTETDVYNSWTAITDNTKKFSNAFGNASHTEGIDTLALYDGDHAQGLRCIARGPYAFAGGQDTYARGNRSVALGLGTKTNVADQMALGKYNQTNPNALLIIGNGTANNARNNAFTVNKDGSATIQTSGTDDLNIVNYKQLREYVSENGGHNAWETQNELLFGENIGKISVNNVTIEDNQVAHILLRNDDCGVEQVYLKYNSFKINSNVENAVLDKDDLSFGNVELDVQGGNIANYGRNDLSMRSITTKREDVVINNDGHPLFTTQDVTSDISIKIDLNGIVFNNKVIKKVLNDTTETNETKSITWDRFFKVIEKIEALIDVSVDE